MKEKTNDYLIGRADICHEEQIESPGLLGSDHVLRVLVFDQDNIKDINGEKEYSWMGSEPVYETGFCINDSSLKSFLKKASCYEGFEGYPPASCYLLDRDMLLEMVNAFPKMFNSLDRASLTEKQYIIVMIYWD